MVRPGHWGVRARVERFSEPALLLLLRERPTHGYELLEALPALTGEARVDMGNLYRVLRALEEDGLVTSRVLAAAIGRAPFDLVVAGVESTDGYTGTVPVTVAELLGIASVTAIRSLEPSDGGARIERMTEGGFDVYESPLPVVVTVTAGSVEPRYPSLKGIMQAKQKPVERPSLAELGVADVTSTQHVTSVTDAPVKGGGEIVQGDEAVTRIADLLAEAKVI